MNSHIPTYAIVYFIFWRLLLYFPASLSCYDYILLQTVRQRLSWRCCHRLVTEPLLNVIRWIQPKAAVCAKRRWSHREGRVPPTSNTSSSPLPDCNYAILSWVVAHTHRLRQELNRRQLSCMAMTSLWLFTTRFCEIGLSYCNQYPAFKNGATMRFILLMHQTVSMRSSRSIIASL